MTAPQEQVRVTRITAGDAQAARDLLKKYDEQSAADRIKEWDDRKAWLTERNLSKVANTVTTGRLMLQWLRARQSLLPAKPSRRSAMTDAIEVMARTLCQAEGYAFYAEDELPDGHYGRFRGPQAMSRRVLVQEVLNDT